MIEGGHALSGRLRAAGNKNGALPILAACLLTDEPVTLENVPRIRDVDTMLGLLSTSAPTWSGRAERRARARPEHHARSRRGAREPHPRVVPARRPAARTSRPRDVPPRAATSSAAAGSTRTSMRSRSSARRSSTGPLRAFRRARRRAHPPRRGVGHGDRERGDGRDTRTGQDDDLERGVGAARAGSLPLPRSLGGKIDGIGSNVLHVTGVEGLSGGGTRSPPSTSRSAASSAWPR